MMRISGITVDPSGEDLTLALTRLEDMAEEFKGRNIVVDYNFEESPATGSLHNIPRKYWYAYKINLAVRLLSDFGKQITPVLGTQQQAAFSFLAASTAPIRETQYPTRMPVGVSNARRSIRWSRFYEPEVQSPLSAKTNIMFINDVKAFAESFVDYLDAAETISSYTIEADSGLTVSSDANATPFITYTITAGGLSAGGSVARLQVKIVVTTSASRILNRIINFQLIDSDIKGQ